MSTIEYTSFLIIFTPSTTEYRGTEIFGLQSYITKKLRLKQSWAVCIAQFPSKKPFYLILFFSVTVNLGEITFKDYS